MTYFEDAPVGLATGDWWDWPDADREEWLTDTFGAITTFDHERRHVHDLDGFYAQPAGSEPCLALGHTYDPDRSAVVGDDMYEPADLHPFGWGGGGPICTATRYGVACTYCEGECDHHDVVPVLWGLPGVQAVPEDSSTARWVDEQGDVWRLGDDGLLHTPETQPFPREHVEKKWGPLWLLLPRGGTA